ncbi:MAG: hypothetical protein GWN77_00060, partial [Gammaproteobacteria bacterium]|nr:hypothetical protein [Gammaproteobacteria bacterium]
TDDFGWGLYPDFATFTNSVGFDADYAAIDTIDACYVDGVDCPGDFPASWFAVLGTGTTPTVSDITPETEWAIDVPNRTLNETWFVDTDATNGQEIVSWQVLTNAIADLAPTLSESDPVFTASPAGGIVAQDITNWDAAFGWGDHATNGYLTAEIDPAFTASVAANITITDTNNWTTAYNWGDHATNGYQTGTEQYIGDAQTHVAGGDLDLNGHNIRGASSQLALGFTNNGQIDIYETLNLAPAPFSDNSMVFGTNSYLYDASLTQVMRPNNKLLMGLWEINADATNGQEVVNYQSMTNYTYSALEINTIVTGATARVGFKVDSGVVGTTP